MKLRSAVLGSALAFSLMMVACKDDPLFPKGSGRLVITAVFDSSLTVRVTSMSRGDVSPGSGEEGAARPGADEASPAPRLASFSISALDDVEITLLQDGNVFRQIPGTLSGNQWIATDTEIPVGTYQVTVAGFVGSDVQWYGTASATVREDTETSTTITLLTFRPSLTALPAISFSTTVTLTWSTIQNVENYVVQFANNDNFVGGQSRTLSGSTRSAAFAVTEVGTYWGRVRAANTRVGARGSFSTAISTSIVAESSGSSGDDAGTALSLGFAGNLGGASVSSVNILPAGDADWFAFDACTSDNVTVIMKTGSLSPASALEATLQVMDSDAATLLDEDASTGTADKTLSGSLPSAGTFFVVVRGQGSSVGQYELQFSVVPGPFTNVQTTQCTVTTQGTRIAYASDGDGSEDNEIFVRTSDGDSYTQLTDNTADDDDPSWSPDGTLIAFTSDRTSGFHDVWVMGPDGTNQVNITNQSASSDFYPSWFPDGTRLVWGSNRSGDHDIYVAASDGGGVFNFLNLPSSEEFQPTFSPDGSKLAFVSDMDGDFEVYLIDTDGTNLLQLTTTTTTETLPRFSPDGTQIVFISRRDDPNGDVFVMNSDGSSQTSLTPGATSFEGNATWGPDGQQIIFQSNRDGTFALYIMNADGSGVAKLRDTAVREFWPTWEKPRTVASDLGVSIIQAPDTLLLSSVTLGSNALTAVVDNSGEVSYIANGDLLIRWLVNDVPDFFNGGTEQQLAVQTGPNTIPAQNGFDLPAISFPANASLPNNPLDPGTAYFLALVDANDVIAESDEGNNTDIIAVPSGIFLAETDTDRLVFGDVGSGDIMDLYISQDEVARGLMIFAIPDIGSTFDPVLQAHNSRNSYGGDNDGIDGVVTNTIDATLGTGRIINLGEVVAFPVTPDPSDGFINTAIEVESAGADGQYQIRIERCALTGMAVGDVKSGTLSAGDCVMWPNPLSGNVTYAQMFTFDAAVGDSVAITMSSGAFDAALFLFDPNGDLLFSNDDFDTTGDALVGGFLLGDGTYSIIASTVDELLGGSFSVSLVAGQGGVAPDLVVDFVNAPDSVVVSLDADLVMSAQVTNIGNADIPAGWELAVIAVGDLGATDAINVYSMGALAAGASVNLAIDTILTINVSTGVGRFRVVADPFDDIGESDEGNNQLESGPTAFTALGNYGSVFRFFTDAAGDTLDLVRFVSQPGDGILLYSIPDTATSTTTSSGIDPSLRLSSATNADIGGDLDEISTGIATQDPSDPRIGERIITGGEVIGVLAGGTAENNQLLIEPAKGTAGRVQLVIQNCFVRTGTYGAQVTDSIISSDCILWPNHISGQRTRGVFVSFTSAVGDSVSLSLTAVDSLDMVMLLFGPDGSLIEADDDSGTDFNSFLTGTIEMAGNYMVLVTTYDLLDTGAWQLDISGPSGVSPNPNTSAPDALRTDRVRTTLTAPPGQAGAQERPTSKPR